MLVVFALVLYRNLKRLRQDLEWDENAVEYTTITLNIAIGLEFTHIILQTLQLVIYALNGSGFAFIGFFADLFCVLSQLVVIILLIFMSTGWGIRNMGEPDMDVFIPILILVFIVQIMVTIISTVVEESYYTFSDYDGLPGYLIIIMRVLMWIWFVVSIFFNFEEKSGNIADFVTNLMIMGSAYIMSMPTIIAFSWLFSDVMRSKMIIIGTFVI
jgi:hypothetical protein